MNEHKKDITSWEMFTTALVELASIDEFYKEQLKVLLNAGYYDLKLLHDTLSQDKADFFNNMDEVLIFLSRHKQMYKDKEANKINKGAFKK